MDARDLTEDDTTHHLRIKSCYGLSSSDAKVALAIAEAETKETTEVAEAQVENQAQTEVQAQTELETEGKTKVEAKSTVDVESIVDETKSKAEHKVRATDCTEAKADVETEAKMEVQAQPESKIGTFKAIRSYLKMPTAKMAVGPKSESLLRVLKWGLVAGAATTAVVAIVGVGRLHDAKDRCRKLAVGCKTLAEGFLNLSSRTRINRDGDGTRHLHLTSVARFCFV